jgi:hypothetical protein
VLVLLLVVLIITVVIRYKWLKQPRQIIFVEILILNFTIHRAAQAVINGVQLAVNDGVVTGAAANQPSLLVLL